MTMQHRRSAELEATLVDLARGPYPEYIDDVLARTARSRQRPTWTFPERWLPMFGIASEQALAPRFPWRAIAIALIVIALMVVAVVALIAGAQPRIPAPFGVADNGLIAFERGGDIYTADPATGVERAIVTGSQTDAGPRFSLDGTRIVFERKLDYVHSQLYLARSDGTDLTLLTPEPLTLAAGDLGRAWEKYQLSPDGRTVLMATETSGVHTITIAQADGKGVRRLDVGMSASEPSFRPPNGAEILFIGDGEQGLGLFAVNIATEKGQADPADPERIWRGGPQLVAGRLPHRLLEVGRDGQRPDGQDACPLGRRDRRPRAPIAPRRRVECPRDVVQRWQSDLHCSRVHPGLWRCARRGGAG